MEELKRLAIDAVCLAAQIDLDWYNQEGAGPTYEMDGRLIDLVRASRAAGLQLPPLYDGHVWPASI